MGIEIDLGAPGDTVEATRLAFARRGVPLSRETIRKLRSGAAPPERTAYRLHCVDRLRANDATLKTDYCLRVVGLGREMRKRSQEPPRIYACHGLTLDMAGALAATRMELSQVN